MRPEEQEEIILEYLEGRLPEDHNFHKQVMEDPLLMEEVQEFRMVREAMIDHRLNSFKNKLSDYHLNTPVKSTPAHLDKRILFLITGLILIGVAIFTWNNIGSDPSSKQASSQKSTGDTFSIPLSNLHEDKTPRPKENEDKSMLPKIDKNEKVAIPQSIFKSSEPIAIDSGKSAASAIPTLNSHIDSTISKVKTDPCIGISFKASVISVRPCSGQNNGSIELRNVRGSEGPVYYSITGKNFISVDQSFDQLSPGNYDITVKNEHSCTGLIESGYALLPKVCLTNRNLVFNPEYGQLEIPKQTLENCKLQIYEKGGKMVFIKIGSGSDPFYWDGRGEEGQLSPGLYFYNIESNGVVLEQGTIAITY